MNSLKMKPQLMLTTMPSLKMLPPPPYECKKCGARYGKFIEYRSHSFANPVHLIICVSCMENAALNVIAS